VGAATQKLNDAGREVAHQPSPIIEGFIPMIICSAVKPARCECWGWREWGNVTHDRREFVRHDERVFMLL
jgi:hypothetical protein